MSPIVEDTVYYKLDGSIEYTIISEFAKVYYDLEEVTAMAEKEVEEFEGRIQVKSAEVEEGILTMVYAIQDVDTYNEYFDTKNFYGTVQDALDLGYDLGENIVGVDERGGYPIKVEEVLDHTILIWGDDIIVRTGKQVAYHKEGVELVNHFDSYGDMEVSDQYYVIIEQ